MRGLGVLPGGRLTTPAKLVEFHRRFDARSAASRQLVIVVQLAVAVAAAGAVGGRETGGAVAVVLAVVFLLGARRWATVRSSRSDLVSS